jgi:hypothetical protein
MTWQEQYLRKQVNLEVNEMKKTITIEIETDDNLPIYPFKKDGETLDFDLPKEKLAEFRKQYSQDLIEDVVRILQNCVEDNEIIDQLDDAMYIEDMDELKDYGIKVVVK